MTNESLSPFGLDDIFADLFEEYDIKPEQKPIKAGISYEDEA